MSTTNPKRTHLLNFFVYLPRIKLFIRNFVRQVKYKLYGNRRFTQR